MLTVFGKEPRRDCAGNLRRNFLRVGSAGFVGLTLPSLLRAKSKGYIQSDKSVIWIWLGGGSTHVETFDPKMSAPNEYRSMTGEVQTPIPGITIGGTFPLIAQVADKFSFVRSFAHGNSSHSTGTELVMSGHKNPLGTKPSLGSMVSRLRGTTDARTGMPTYVRAQKIRSDGPGWLGTAFSPFSVTGQARNNMRAVVPAERFKNREQLRQELDRINRAVDSSGTLEGLDGFEQQATELVLGSSQDAFDISKEDQKTRELYGPGFGTSLLMARRLCEAGVGLVSLSWGGWDMHRGLVKLIKSRSPQLDQGVAALITDLNLRGMLDDTLVVITGEFGRTPRINRYAGRDHWGRLCTLALAGGGLNTGQIVGESSPKIEVPTSNPISPQDVLATILKMYGFDPRAQFDDNAGRPTYLIENGEPISELVG